MSQPVIYINGEIGKDTTLLDVIRQVKANKDADSYLVKIDSEGGLVNVGEDIYNYLRNLDKPVTTMAIQAYSIASMIFMAGSTRIVSEGSPRPLMIHLPWCMVQGNAEKLQAYQLQLQEVENQLIDFYSQALEIDRDTIQSLLQKETYLSATQALELGFATQVQATAKAVAKLSNNKEEEQNTFMNKLEQKLDSIYNKLMGIKNQLILQDSTGAELTFPDLAEADLAEAGAKVTLDGKPAEGTFIMPDGSTLVAEKGVVTEIKPVEEPAEEEAPAEAAVEDEIPAEEAPEAEDEKDAVIADLEAKIAELEAKLAELLPADAANKMVEALKASIDKQEELESKFHALAKSVGSDFTPDTNKETNPTVKASADSKSRAWLILNS